MNEFAITIELSEGKPGRKCGTCQLCCRLLPVRAVHKDAGKRCKHQRFGKGCAVYAKLESIAPECRQWSCRWLLGTTAPNVGRPDRAHYVIDVLPDFVYAREIQLHVPAVQVWLDPAYPDAHRDPTLRAWLAELGRTERTVAIVRYDNRRGFVLVPPAMTNDGAWLELPGLVAQQGSTWPGRKPELID